MYSAKEGEKEEGVEEEGEGEEVKGNWRGKEAQFSRTTLFCSARIFSWLGPCKTTQKRPKNHDLGCCHLKNDPKFAETLVTSKSTQKR